MMDHTHPVIYPQHVLVSTVTDLRSLERCVVVLGFPEEIVLTVRPHGNSLWDEWMAKYSNGKGIDLHPFVGSTGFRIGTTFIIYDDWARTNSQKEDRISVLNGAWGNGDFMP